MNKKNKFKVAILGAGKIGALFDTPSQKVYLTHAHAFKSHPDFDLVAIYDVDRTKAKAAAERWQIPVWGTDLPDEPFDVVSVAVSDEFHYPVLKQLVEQPIKLVFLEKPIAINMAQALEIKKLFTLKKLPVAVNYRRRFVPEFQTLKKEIEKLGAFISGGGYYGKGVLHNGSHLIDLLRFFIGVPLEFTLLGYDFDYDQGDPSVSAALSFAGGGLFVMQHVDPKLYTVFEIDLLFAKGRIRIVDSGFKIEIQRIMKDDRFQGYKNIEKEKEYLTSLDRALYFCADGIARFLRRGCPLACSFEDGLKNMEVCDRLAKAAKRNEKAGSFICS